MCKDAFYGKNILGLILCSSIFKNILLHVFFFFEGCSNQLFWVGTRIPSIWPLSPQGYQKCCVCWGRDKPWGELVQRKVSYTYILFAYEFPACLSLWRSRGLPALMIKHSILNKWKVSSKRTVVSYWYGSETLKFGMKKVHKFLVSTEIVVLWPWDSETWKFGVIKQVTSVKELESCCFEC